MQEASLRPGHSFVDVGSGLGKLVVAAACATPDEVPCYGVEISPFRWASRLSAPNFHTVREDETVMHVQLERYLQNATDTPRNTNVEHIFHLRCHFHAVARHQTAQEGLQVLQSIGGITPREADGAVMGLEVEFQSC